ncbi:cytochrome o ubiquinol oxidase subunit 2 [Rhizomicrobium palustre]|uniref:Ubiquinol oxidase subunit 2 n=1 Tax=Rhizomicrobium palustre TaxID=189966 RepID=A0A846MU53_9PROT|nr:cytochrome o ubiquinol oxidase subunit 2 [Rhizomicrobium palustre]
MARYWRIAGLISLSTFLCGCEHGVLAPAGPIGEAERTILFDAVAIMLAIIIPVMIATVAVAWWFRASNTRAVYRPEFTYSGRIEMIVWSIPALVIIFLGGIAWIGSHDLDPAKPIAHAKEPLEIEVVALDWKWLFIYPGQGIASINRLVVPADTPLKFRITSASVFNVFWVPRLGSEIYAMNGMVTQLNLLAYRPGTYPGLSAHFSGDGFSDMQFDVVAVPQSDFTAWADKTRSQGPALDKAAYHQLLQQSQNHPQVTYRAVEAGLFDKVAMRDLPPGPGPDEGRGGPHLSPKPER